MLPTDVLVQEHRIIVQMLACLEKVVERHRCGGQLSAEHLGDAIDFFRNYADRCHHGKEEAYLFPAMESKGFSRQFGPTGVMLHEHELGRGYVKAMSDALDAYEKGTESAANELCMNAAAYIAMLRQHIEKEDHCLFPMANQMFDEDDQTKLAETFRKVDESEIGLETIDKYVELTERLATQYGVTGAREQRSAEPARGGPCGV